MIEVGEIFSVDGILIETYDLLIDESDITGESDPIEKNPESLIISGTKVIQGSGLLIN
jgi:magnesium-transporting ATPase (P-type)